MMNDTKKYPVPHSEVKEILHHINSGDVLDLGCGKGRNSIFLCQAGFNVTALDISEPSIQHLKKIIASDKQCKNIKAEIYDIETATISHHYDMIISTVVLQFLNSICIRKVIANIQNQTKIEGINLIVAPISTI
ncbi:MAG: methyltransferase domain-containing protein, partial [Pseudomonadota bacterium]